MSTFALDLWHDLREKRLWPLALVLLIALLAVPVLLLKSAPTEDEAPLPTSAAGPKPAGQALVQAVDRERSSSGSDLGVFSGKDPFLPRLPVRPGAGVADVATPTTPDTSTGATGASTGNPSLGGREANSEGGSTPAGAAGGGGGAPTSSDPVSVDRPAKRRTRLYTYVAVVEFGKRGFESKRTLKRLRILPNDHNPLLVFLGVDADRTRAVFLADSTLSQSGEGVCKPSVKTCTFIYLSTKEAHNEHFVSSQSGAEYVVKLLDIKRVRVRSGGRRKKKASSSSHRSGRRVARAFNSLVFADESR